MKYHIGRSQSYCIILLPRNRILFSWDGECTNFFLVYFIYFVSLHLWATASPLEP
jgi:hypothetical protein